MNVEGKSADLEIDGGFPGPSPATFSSASPPFTSRWYVRLIRPPTAFRTEPTDDSYLNFKTN